MPEKLLRRGPVVIIILFAGCFHCLCGASLTPSADGLTVYDSTNNVTWLANFNLPAANRFDLPVCSLAGGEPCVNASGSMTYQSAAAWVTAMNAVNYLGHSNWQLPTSPITDSTCTFVGPQNNSFGWGCTGSALGSLYSNGLGLNAPDSAVAVPNLQAGPFSNFQPSLYWTGTSVMQPTNDVGCCATFSFNSGWQGSNIASNILFVLPMLKGRIAGAPAANGTGLQVNPGGATVYDPMADVTWLANANLPASNSFGLAVCKAPGNPDLCVSHSGAMNFNSATQFIKNMNAAAYLGQTNWQLPSADPGCASSYLCTVTNAPLQSLFYTQLALLPGTPVVTMPSQTTGPFTGVRPYLYWTCEAPSVQQPCQNPGPAPGFQWSFWLDNGFQGTDVFAHDMYVTAYFPGARSATTGPEISEVSTAEGESPSIAPNTWVEIKGTQLAPAGDVRSWQTPDFAGGLPTQLDHVSATVNGKNAYVAYISPVQINILTPPDAMSGAVQVVVTNNGAAATAVSALAQALSPSFFVFNGGPYVAAVHVDGTLVGPATLYPGTTTPAKPGEIVEIYANGFGLTNVPVVSGSLVQSGTLATLPVIRIGNIRATVQFAGLVSPGQFQFNVTIPSTVANGDQLITATYGGMSTQSGVLITIHN